MDGDGEEAIHFKADGVLLTPFDQSSLMQIFILFELTIPTLINELDHL